MPAPLDAEELMTRARRWLASGPVSGTELAARLGVSQPTVSRLLREHRAEILTTGRARRTRHILRRRVPEIGPSTSIYEVDEIGASRRVAILHPVGATGFHVESACEDVETKTYDDWPWFLHQLRPGGFLGRRLSARFPELGLPEDPRSWSADQLLRYLTTHGSNAAGALTLGDRALEAILRWEEALREVEPSVLYPRLVDDVLGGAPPGSSAEGEQPKFLVRRSRARPERLVKFSPPLRETVGRRIADLLVVEHHALRVLETLGVPAARSAILEAEGRLFLETERFDRTAKGRVGLLSLEAFDLEFLGDGRRNAWPSIASKLVALDRVPSGALKAVDRLHAFGHLVGNDDMHSGNLSFVVRGHRVLDVAPAYDTAPMFFAPLRGEVPTREWVPTPGPEVARSVWLWAIEAARRVWCAASGDARISRGFRKIASANARKVDAKAELANRLPE